VTTPVAVGDVQSLLGIVELRDIVFYEVSARRLPEPIDDEAGISLEVRVGFDERRVEVRLRGAHRSPLAEILVEAACLFEAAEAFIADPVVVQEFAEKVGVMAVYPYVREALTELAVKIRVPAPVMGLLRAGQVQLTPG